MVVSVKACGVMWRRATFCSCLLMLTLLLCATLTSAGHTERDFKRMRIKELRAFLDERGLTCPGCQEKSDFVRVAYENRDKKPLAISDHREVPEGTFWDVWGGNARQMCKEEVQKRGEDAEQPPYSHLCEVVESAVESYFMQHGKQVASRLKKTAHHMLKTSYKNVYYDAGERLLRRLIRHCLVSPAERQKCESLGYILKTMEGGSADNFKVWITNVGIENTNPMYDILHDRSDL